MHRWVPECGDLFRTHKQKWAHIIPSSPESTAILAEHFFNCACSLMSRQLREAVHNSIQNFLTFLSSYKQGNSYEGNFDDFLFVKSPVSFQ